LEQPDNNGLTPLALAVKKENYDMAHILLDKGANPNGSFKEYKNIPVLLAVQLQNFSLLKLLHSYNATLYFHDDETKENLAIEALKGLRLAFNFKTSNYLKMFEYLIYHCPALLDGIDKGHTLNKHIDKIKGLRTSFRFIWCMMKTFIRTLTYAAICYVGSYFTEIKTNKDYTEPFTNPMMNTFVVVNENVRQNYEKKKELVQPPHISSLTAYMQRL
jgi:hypothetical protein